VRFPVYDKSHPAPDRDLVCVRCGRSLSKCETQITFTAGAFFHGREKKVGSTEEKMEAFFFVSYHRVIAPDEDAYGRVTVVEGAVGGQFDLAFCSIVCFDKFFAELRKELTKQSIDAERTTRRRMKLMEKRASDGAVRERHQAARKKRTMKTQRLRI
jgi:hypothetical protein